MRGAGDGRRQKPAPLVELLVTPLAVTAVELTLALPPVACFLALASSQRAADAQLRAAGDPRTQIQPQRILPGYTPFGQTDRSLAAQAAFTAGMACTDAGRQVLALMGQVVPSQRWGLGRLAGAQLKGGWGPGLSPGRLDGWMERQMGVTRLAGRRVAVTIASSAGSHAAGIASLNAITDWLTRHAHTAALPRRAAC